MISLEDKKWDEMNGAYKTKFNPSEILKLLNDDIFSVEAWDLIWDNLHHQGDIGEASYAIIPNLVDCYKNEKATDWQLYSFVTLVLTEGFRKTNPKIPEWIKSSLQDSLDDLFEMALSDLKNFKDEIWVRSIIGFVFAYKGFIKYGMLISSFNESELQGFLEETVAWSELYESK